MRQSPLHEVTNKKGSRMNIYVGNLPYSTEKEELEELFEEFGDVESVDIIVDRRSGRSRGYGFVSMTDESAAKEAVEALNGEELGGRNLRVDISRPKQPGDSQNRRPSGQRNNQGQQKRPAQQEAAPTQKAGLLAKIKGFFS